MFCEANSFNNGTLTAVAMGSPNLLRLHLVGLIDVDVNTVIILLRRCPLLTAVQLLHCPRLTATALYPEITQLCAHLHSLATDGMAGLTDALFSAFLEARGGQIRLLSLCDCQLLTDTSVTQVAQKCT